MTISTTDNRVNYTADGVLTVFTFDYVVYDEATMTVYLDDVVQGSGYTVNLNADQDTTPGGDVTFDVAPADQADVTLQRLMPNTQLTDYQPYDAFPAETHERALDRLTMSVQQNADALTRVNVAPPSEDLPPVEGEANTASNLGGGTGIFGTKVNVDLRFKSLVAAGSIGIGSDANEITITGTGEPNQSDAEIKVQYEANADTNAFDDAAEAKVAIAIPSDPTVETGMNFINNFVSMTQAAYDLITPDAATVYVIVN